MESSDPSQHPPRHDSAKYDPIRIEQAVQHHWDANGTFRAREAKDVRTFGSARWADPHEIASAGLLGDDGVVLGKLDRNYLRHDGAEHVLCFAPTRSGKGVGLVVPTLLTWPGSSIVHDIKGEN